MRIHLLFASTPFLMTVLFASAQETETRSVQSGVYTDEQAARGAAIFGQTCVACHHPDEFSDGAYMDGWSGQTAHDMIEQIRTTMPQDNPGSLKRKEYVDVAAYFFRMNGLPPGDTEMDVNSVKRIQIEGPYRPSDEFFSRGSTRSRSSSDLQGSTQPRVFSTAFSH